MDLISPTEDVDTFVFEVAAREQIISEQYMALFLLTYKGFMEMFSPL